MQKLLKQVHSENHTMVTVASPNDDFICPLCRKKVLCCDSFVTLQVGYGSTNDGTSLELLVDGHSGFLFLDKSGMPKVAMHLENYMRHVRKKYATQQGTDFPNVTPHVLRHTFCTNAQRAGIDVKSLQYFMGHSNASVTLDVYTHSDYDSAEKAFQKIAMNL